jgi:hypothetical protein
MTEQATTEASTDAMRCTRCGEEIDPAVDYYRIAGWTRPGQEVVLREVLPARWKCRGCVVALRAGAPS